MEAANLWQQSLVILPELILIAGIIVIMLVDLIFGKREGVSALLAIIFYVAGLIILVKNYQGHDFYLFYGQIHVDAIAVIFRMLLLSIGLMVSMMVYRNREMADFLPAELQMLIMASILGAMFMSMSANMMMIYLAIEFVSILSYILTAVKVKSSKAFEGAIKYVLFGAVSSGVLLFGMSWLYGLAGTLSIAELGTRLLDPMTANNQVAILVGSAMVIGGMAYKIAVFPFHSWCPDVYEGAGTPITTFFSVGPKVGGFAIAIRIASEVMPDNVTFFSPLGENLFLLLAVMAAITMTVGNLAALRQNNVKRLLAYSSIAHAGYVLAGFVAFTSFANDAVIFYLIAYTIMNSGAFLVAMAASSDIARDDSMDIESLAGLTFRGRSGAMWAAAMTVFLFSLTGIPPFVGFIGKYYIFSALLQKDLYWLAVIGILNTVVSLYYYMRIVKIMYFGKVPRLNSDALSGLKGVPALYSVLGVGLVLLTFLLGLYPQLVFDLMH